MRYKRYKRRYNSKVVKMKFQSFVDLSTEADTMKIISVNAGGPDVIKRLSPFFQAYKYYKLGGVSIKLIPASTLPVDPTGLSYESGEQTVDPRDQLTPGMCRITNGEDILEDITGLSGDEQRALYNNMLLDPRWYKWMLQTGVKRFGKPRYWQVGQLHQDKWPGAITNVPNWNNDGLTLKGTTAEYEAKKDNGSVFFNSKGGSDPRGLFQTGHRGVLGWMPTDGLQPLLNATNDAFVWKSMIAAVPEVELFKILMPPVHKTNYFYRMFVTETVYFKEPVVLNLNGFRPLDVFHYTGLSLPNSPKDEVSLISDASINTYTGGNDGTGGN